MTRRPPAKALSRAIEAMDYSETAEEKLLDIELARVRAWAYVRRLRYMKRMRVYATERR